MRATAFKVQQRQGDAPPRWLLPLRHLSASSIDMAMRCPEQWRRRYMLGEKARPGSALIVGGAFHGAQEFNYAQKIDSGEDVPTSEVVEFFHDAAWPDKLEEAGGYAEVQWDGKPDELRERGALMVAAYRDNVAPRVQPIAVEQRFEIELGLPVPVIGYVDVERADTLAEMKTSARAMSSPKPDWRLQGRLYQMVKRKPVEWHVTTKTKAPATITPLEEPNLLLEPADDRMTARLVRHVAWAMNHYYATLGPDEPWPGEGIMHPWACQFCGWRPSCRWWT